MATALGPMRPMRLRTFDHADIETVCRQCNHDEDRHDPLLANTYRCLCGCESWNPVQRVRRETHELWLEQPLSAGWVAAQRLTLQEGRVVVAELRVLPDERLPDARRRPAGRWSVDDRAGLASPVPSGGVTARQLRTVRLGPRLHLGPKAAALVRRLVTEAWASPAEASGQPEPAEGSPPATKRLGRRKRGPAPWPDERYARLAVAYEKAVNQDPRAAVVVTTRRLRFKNTAQARDALHRARLNGFLTPGKKGLADGRATDKAKRILAVAGGSPRLPQRKRGRRRPVAKRPGQAVGKAALRELP
jgi:hypothetical protein